MSGALVVVPPYLGYLAGPQAGPAALAAAGAAAGVEVEVLDLNAAWLRGHLPAPGVAVAEVVGDHARPTGGFVRAARSWRSLVAPWLGVPVPGWAAGEDPLWSLCFSHRAVYAAAEALAGSPEGRAWVERMPSSPPRFVGVSVLWSGQVVAALAVSLLARLRYPGTPIVWGGAHVTALADEIARDRAYGRWVDGFVAGPAGETFRRMCAGPTLEAPGVIAAGFGEARRASEDGTRPPRFGRLDGYGVPRLTLPLVTSRGCLHGRCAYCSYPFQEGRYRTLPEAAYLPTIELATASGADLAVKDAFVSPNRLRALAERVAGRARWSACTRLRPRLGPGLLRELSSAGLGTLEVGVESLDPGRLRLLGKPQGGEDLDALLAAAAGTPVHVVVNLIFGFPGQAESEVDRQLADVTSICARHPDVRVTTERNLLQVVRGAPLARSPERWGIRVRASWPWASVLGWDAPAWRAGAVDRCRGHHEIDRRTP